MVVDQRREQVVRRSDGVKIAGEVEVDVLHRHDLGVAAAGRAALHAEARTDAGLAQTDRRLPAPAVERSDEHTTELQSLMRLSYAVFCLKKHIQITVNNTNV